ncbi:MAG: SDR family NAD(P)-dependent oxidoreductase, partial [Planctomycetota bacterium]
MSHWHGKHALVTGGSSGLGLHLAKTLTAAGAAVAIVGRTQSRLDEAADMLRGLGGEVLAVAANVAQPGETRRVVDAALARFDGLDFACACAGKSMRGAAMDTPREAFEELLRVNFLAALDLAQAAGPHLEAAAATRGTGHLVLIGSLASKTASPLLGAYPASKFPLAALAQQLRLERGPQGLHTLLVCPGPVARGDAGRRYDTQADGLPAQARQPGGGAKLRAIDPATLAAKILSACEARRAELVLPKRARLLFAAAQLCPPLGDWLVRR